MTMESYIVHIVFHLLFRQLSNLLPHKARSYNTGSKGVVLM